jgi:hypothetical protein
MRNAGRRVRVEEKKRLDEGVTHIKGVNSPRENLCHIVGSTVKAFIFRRIGYMNKNSLLIIKYYLINAKYIMNFIYNQ